MLSIRSYSSSLRAFFRIAKNSSCLFSTRARPLIGRLQEIVRRDMPTHPFKHHLHQQNAKPVMEKYAAMSQAFPYIQSGAYSNVIKRCMRKNTPVPVDVEKTFVAGAFLSWDETGGHHLIGAKGNQALPEVLNTRQNFHANLLDQDLRNMFGCTVTPNYCPNTRAYLIQLFNNLGSIDPIKRVAMMVAFEMHAEQMLVSLWESLSKITPIPKEELTYFQTHVGGDDPLEAYHVALTQELVKQLVPQSKEDLFIKMFGRLYELNVSWCRAITK